MSSSSKKSRNTRNNPSVVLPDDLLVSCLARVSRLYYPTLSLLSKKIRSLLVSSEFYKVRSQVGRTESCLYVCLRYFPEPNPHWFTLCIKPNRTGGYYLIPVSPPHSPARVHTSSLVSVGSNIYEIGGVINGEDEPSSRVSVLDCWSHTWHQAPELKSARKCAAVTAIDGQIYVAGGREDCGSSNWMEVFDPKTQTWSSVSNPNAMICDKKMVKSINIDGKVYMYGDRGVAYNPKNGTCEPLGCSMCRAFAWRIHCVIDNVLFENYYEGIRWYDAKLGKWRAVKGLTGLSLLHQVVRLADYGGKMIVLGEKTLGTSEYKEKMIRYAEIALERRDNEDIWGTIVWFNDVLKVPKICEIVSVLTATV